MRAGDLGLCLLLDPLHLGGELGGLGGKLFVRAGDLGLCLLPDPLHLGGGLLSEGIGLGPVLLGGLRDRVGATRGTLGGRRAALSRGYLCQRLPMGVLDLRPGGLDVPGGAKIEHHGIKILAQIGDPAGQLSQTLVECGPGHGHRGAETTALVLSRGRVLPVRSARLPRGRAVVDGTAFLVRAFAVARRPAGGGIRAAGAGASRVRAQPVGFARQG